MIDREALEAFIMHTMRSRCLQIPDLGSLPLAERDSSWLAHNVADYVETFYCVSARENKTAEPAQ